MSVTYTWGAHSYEICFTWEVFATLEDEWGDEWAKRLARLFVGQFKDLPYVAHMTTGGAFDPSARVPAIPFSNAIYRAFILAWEGRTVKAEEPEASTPEKKPNRFVALLRRIFRHG